MNKINESAIPNKQKQSNEAQTLGLKGLSTVSPMQLHQKINGKVAVSKKDVKTTSKNVNGGNKTNLIVRFVCAVKMKQKREKQQISRCVFEKRMKQSIWVCQRTASDD